MPKAIRSAKNGSFSNTRGGPIFLGVEGWGDAMAISAAVTLQVLDRYFRDFCPSWKNTRSVRRTYHQHLIGCFQIKRDNEPR